MRITFARTLAVTVVFAMAGCGGASDGINREPVSGEVTLDGQPISQGEITFVPAGGGEPVAAAIIENGRYTVERANGPSPGPQRINVWSKKPTGKKFPSDVEPGTFIEETRESIPDRYNLKSELKAEVKEGGDNRFDFTLQSEKSVPKSTRR
ncbi:hypothetical protein V5E97_02100 [Singulisphaera sp. Ch08]|uniref:Carboxypeptidase regulatory-like domain-containing protein n=1 Tax=Singulisphaera sp. Ch08 TaxID=3120278 RepID=A0AAU7CHJ4_9BACT